jgi:hypothetical protein
MNNDDLRFL